MSNTEVTVFETRVADETSQQENALYDAASFVTDKTEEIADTFDALEAEKHVLPAYVDITSAEELSSHAPVASRDEQVPSTDVDVNCDTVDAHDASKPTQAVRFAMLGRFGLGRLFT